MADDFATSHDSYSIAVAGNMNPAIHHPAWYNANGLISSEEAETAQNRDGPRDSITGNFGPDDVVCMPVYAQFTAPPFRVVCTPDSWTISTFDAAAVERICEICSKVFEILPHTPVGSFSINFSHHRSTELTDVGQKLANLLRPVLLGVAVPRTRAAASLHYTFYTDNDQLNLTVEASVRAPSMVYVGMSFLHQIRAQGFFELRPLLERGLEDARTRAKSTLENIVAALNSMEEGNA